MIKMLICEVPRLMKTAKRYHEGALCTQLMSYTHKNVPGIEMFLIIMKFRAMQMVCFNSLIYRQGHKGPEKHKDLPKGIR